MVVGSRGAGGFRQAAAGLGQQPGRSSTRTCPVVVVPARQTTALVALTSPARYGPLTGGRVRPARPRREKPMDIFEGPSEGPSEAATPEEITQVRGGRRGAGAVRAQHAAMAVQPPRAGDRAQRQQRTAAARGRPGRPGDVHQLRRRAIQRPGSAALPGARARGPRAARPGPAQRDRAGDLGRAGARGRVRESSCSRRSRGAARTAADSIPARSARRCSPPCPEEAAKEEAMLGLMDGAQRAAAAGRRCRGR